MVKVTHKGEWWIVTYRGRIIAKLATADQANTYARGFADDLRWLASNR